MFNYNYGYYDISIISFEFVFKMIKLKIQSVINNKRHSKNSLFFLLLIYAKKCLLCRRCDYLSCLRTSFICLSFHLIFGYNDEKSIEFANDI